MPVLGDYIEIPNMQNNPATDGALGFNRISGGFFNVITTAVVHITICSFSTPFRLSVHFNADETVNSLSAPNANSHDHIENHTPVAGNGKLNTQVILELMTFGGPTFYIKSDLLQYYIL